MKTALVMAGGRSTRMRATAGAEHKALRPVLGVSLLERNLCRLLDYGFRTIAVAVNAQEDLLRRYVTGRARALAEARDCTLELLLEQRPLGTIGVVSRFRTSTEPVVVVNGDNLTNLDLRALLARHRAVRASMTVAVHREPFRIPLGEVTVDGGRLVGYAEKPIHEVLISSGAYVIEPDAAAQLRPGERCDVPRLVSLVAEAGGKIAAHPHTSLWIDVNDAADLQRCEGLVRDHPDEFERWDSEPDRHVLNLLVRAGSELMVARSSQAESDMWGLPSIDCAGPGPSRADVRLLWMRCGQKGSLPQRMKRLTFDELDVHGGTLVRRHVVDAHGVNGTHAANGGGTQQWVQPAAPGRIHLSPTVHRALGHLGLPA